MMKSTVCFTISKNSKGTCDVVNKGKYNSYSRYDVPQVVLFETLDVLSDIFNNDLDLAIVFDVE